MLTPSTLNGSSLQLKPTKIPADEWSSGEFYFVATMNGLQRDELETLYTEWRDVEDNSIRQRALVVAFAWCDEKNNRLVPNDKLGDVADSLLQRAAAPLMRGFDVFCSVNALSATDVEALTKN